MKTFTAVALAACASMVTASPLDMMKKRQVFKTIVTTENGVPHTYVEETVPETVVITTTLDGSTTTVWHTSALVNTDLPLLSLLVKDIPLISRIVEALNPSPSSTSPSESSASESSASESSASESSASESSASESSASESSASESSASESSASESSASESSASEASESSASEPAPGAFFF